MRFTCVLLDTLSILLQAGGDAFSIVSSKGVDAPCAAPFLAARRVKARKQANAHCLYMAVDSMWCVKLQGGDAEATSHSSLVSVIHLIDDVSVGDELVV